MNEEDIKVKIVLPFLERLGIHLSELKFEKSFTIKVGRHVLDVTSGQKKRGNVGARLDILITRNGNNLFILEVKENEHALTDADRDQAVSYARLVHPIAPFALVTNGQDWKLFDSITKESISPENFDVNGANNIALPDDLRSEALEMFLGLSLENVRLFCSKQVDSQMKPLVGSPFELTKKYIPELNVPRLDLINKLDDFIRGDKEGFLVLADSGIGKTSALCHYANVLLEKEIPALFFRGWSLESGLFSAISDEFNWSFSEEQSPVNLVRRLHGIFKDRPVVVIVDAIDEWQYIQKRQNLISTLKAVRGMRVKFLISCKSGSWKPFSETQGSPTGIEEYLHRVPQLETTKSEYVLGELDDHEFYQALQKYRNIFDFNGKIEDRVLEEAKRNPFLLRVIFVVASKTKTSIISFSSTQLFEEYYKRLLDKTGASELAAAQLCGIAGAIWEQNSGWLETSVLRGKLGLGLNETILSSLFEHNILIRSSSNEEHIGFYFQQFRDFIICFKHLAWQRLNDNELQTAVEPFQKKGFVFDEELSVRADALAFYFRHASEAHQRVLAGELYENAHNYLARYVEIIEKHFPSAKEIFEPRTEGKIGFIGELFVTKKCIGGYGFRKIREDEAPVFFVPASRMFSGLNSPHFHGANHFRYSGSVNGFIDVNIEREVINNEIVSQIESLIKSRSLFEGKNPELLNMRLISLLYGNRNTFRPFFDLSGDVLQYPISLSRVKDLWLREKLYRAFTDELVQQKREKGTAKETHNGGGLQVSCTIFPAELEIIRNKIDHAVASGMRPQILSHFVDLDFIENLLNKASKHGCEEIRKPRWVERYILFEALRQDAHQGVKFCEEYVFNLFEAFLENYELLVSANFPTLKNAFDLYKKMPVQVFIQVSPTLATGINSNWWGGANCQVSYVICKNPEIQCNRVTLCSTEEFPKHFGNFKFKGADYEFLSWNSCSFVDLTSHADYTIENPIHNLVYEKIKKEIPYAFNLLRQTEIKQP